MQETKDTILDLANVGHINEFGKFLETDSQSPPPGTIFYHPTFFSQNAPKRVKTRFEGKKSEN